MSDSVSPHSKNLKKKATQGDKRATSNSSTTIAVIIINLPLSMIIFKCLITVSPISCLCSCTCPSPSGISPSASGTKSLGCFAIDFSNVTFLQLNDFVETPETVTTLSKVMISSCGYLQSVDCEGGICRGEKPTQPKKEKRKRNKTTETTGKRKRRKKEAHLQPPTTTQLHLIARKQCLINVNKGGKIEKQTWFLRNVGRLSSIMNPIYLDTYIPVVDQNVVSPL